jgi:excisionase family DNA binding protein
MGGRAKGSKNSTRKDLRSAGPVMDATEVCIYLLIHRATLYRYIKIGQIPYFRIGRDYRFNREMVDDLMGSS